MWVEQTRKLTDRGECCRGDAKLSVYAFTRGLECYTRKRTVCDGTASSPGTATTALTQTSQPAWACGRVAEQTSS